MEAESESNSSYSGSIGISSVGWYCPRYRMTRQAWGAVWSGADSDEIRAIAVADWDEDVITMAVCAGEDALERIGATAASVDEVYVATVSSPYQLKSAAALVATALGAERARVVDFGSSTCASGDAVIAAADAVALGRVHRVLVIGADAIPAAKGAPLEARFGAAACAVIIDSHAALARIEGIRFNLSTVTSQWQPAGSAEVLRYDDIRFDRETRSMPNLVKAAGFARAGDVVSMPGVGSKQAAQVIRRANIAETKTVASGIFTEMGDTGNASGLLCLAGAIAVTHDGAGITAVFEGSGSGSQSIRMRRQHEVLRGTPADPPAQIQEVDYVTFLKMSRRLVAPSAGEPLSAFGASPAAARQEITTLRPAGQLCGDCGAYNFLPAPIVSTVAPWT